MRTNNQYNITMDVGNWRRLMVDQEQGLLVMETTMMIMMYTTMTMAMAMAMALLLLMMSSILIDGDWLVLVMG